MDVRGFPNGFATPCSFRLSSRPGSVLTGAGTRQGQVEGEMITTKRGLQVLGAVTTPLPPDSDSLDLRTQSRGSWGDTNLPKRLIIFILIYLFIFLMLVLVHYMDNRSGRMGKGFHKGPDRKASMLPGCVSLLQCLKSTPAACSRKHSFQAR